jgi:hypothetical protein
MAWWVRKANKLGCKRSPGTGHSAVPGLMTANSGGADVTWSKYRRGCIDASAMGYGVENFMSDRRLGCTHAEPYLTAAFRFMPRSLAAA